jgi:transcriptional regulator with XRE-family HTH domain
MWRVSNPTPVVRPWNVLPIGNDFADGLYEWRKLHYYEQKDLARELGVRRETVCRWECGKQFPDGKLLRKLYQLGLPH